MTPSLILRDESIRARAIERIRMLKIDPENPWGVWIAPWVKLRTLSQNAAYWRLIAQISKATGHDKDALHEYFKRKVLGIRVSTIAEENVEVVQSSARVSRGDFSELIDFVNAWCAEHGIEEAA